MLLSGIHTNTSIMGFAWNSRRHLSFPNIGRDEIQILSIAIGIISILFIGPLECISFANKMLSSAIYTFIDGVEWIIRLVIFPLMLYSLGLLCVVGSLLICMTSIGHLTSSPRDSFKGWLKEMLVNTSYDPPDSYSAKFFAPIRSLSEEENRFLYYDYGIFRLMKFRGEIPQDNRRFLGILNTWFPLP